MNLELMEPITLDNIHKLKPGEWIWDNRVVHRLAHKSSFDNEHISEPTGFRQIHILDVGDLGSYTHHPFMLSNVYSAVGASWVTWSEGRFWRFREDV